MERKVQADNLGEIAKCIWCDARIGLAYHVRTRVCVKCFRRLRSENVPDPQIFGSETAEAPGIINSH